MINPCIPNQLYQSSRPGYGSVNVSLAEVESWIEKVKKLGVRTIICLLTDDQLGYYRSIPGGLLETYKKHGFAVIHRPITDPAHDEKGWEELENSYEILLQDFMNAEKPVLIHCSAGQDRSPHAARYIQSHIR